MSLPKSLQLFFDEQKARYGGLFWFQEQNGKIVLMIEKLAEKAKEILIKENVNGAVEIVSFEADDSVGEFYIVEAEQIDVETRPDKQEYKSIMDQDLKTVFTDLTNDIYKDQRVKVFQPQGYSSFCVVVYHSFNLDVPRGPIGWIKNLDGLRPVPPDRREGLKKKKGIKSKDFLSQTKKKKVPFEEACQKLEGVKYQMGGGSFKNGFDCSALVQRVFYETRGVWLPRKARWQRLVCEPVELKDLRQGDLVFFNKIGRDNDGIDHVALVWEARTGKAPMVFHSKRINNRAKFEDLSKAKWLGTWEVSGFGRVKQRQS